jgi:hypothetical protein
VHRVIQDLPNACKSDMKIPSSAIVHRFFVSEPRVTFVGSRFRSPGYWSALHSTFGDVFVGGQYSFGEGQRS